MKRNLKFYDRLVGDGCPVYIIAEIGSNHNNNLQKAKQLINEAKKAGADAVKFQLFRAETDISRKAHPHPDYSENLFELTKSLELNRSWLPELKKFSEIEGIHFFATTCDIEAIILMEKLGVDIFKVGSFELTDLNLIAKMAKTGKNLILSTGITNITEIQQAINIALSNNNRNIALLHCISLYPAPPDTTNLSAIATLKKTFNFLTGFSDHTIGDHITVAAIAAGAEIIEKHFTLDKKDIGPDHSFALVPEEFREMVRKIRETEAAMGNGIKNGPSAQEINNFKLRRSLHAARAIPSGKVIEAEDLVIKRPGLGLKPAEIDKVLGKKALRTIDAEEWIILEMVEKAK